MTAEKLNVVIAPAGGAFGTALAIPLLAAGCESVLVFRDGNKNRDFQLTRQVERLPRIIFPPTLSSTADLAAALEKADLLILSTPTACLESYYGKQVMPVIKNQTGVALLAKGIVRDGDKCLTPYEALLKLDPRLRGRLAVLSGPNFAKEIACGLPFATVVASENREFAERMVDVFTFTPQYRIYPSVDPRGVSVGAAGKNVIAIAAGISDGCGFGESARAALIERGKVEIIRLGVALGGKRETLAEGLTDADLWMTCTSQQSRNHQFGEGVGQGRDPKELLAEFEREKKVVEGFETTEVMWMLAREHGVRAPIIDAVYHVLHKGVSIGEAIAGLLTKERVYEDGRPLTNGRPFVESLVKQA